MGVEFAAEATVLTREAFVAGSPVILGSGGVGVPDKVIVGVTGPAYFPGAELEVLSNAGHYPMFEVPVVLAASVERFPGCE